MTDPKETPPPAPDGELDDEVLDDVSGGLMKPPPPTPSPAPRLM